MHMHVSKEYSLNESFDVCDVCETPLKDLGKAYSTEYGDMLLLFCSESCFKRYLEDPELFGVSHENEVLE